MFWKLNTAVSYNLILFMGNKRKSYDLKDYLFIIVKIQEHFVNYNLFFVNYFKVQCRHLALRLPE